MLLEDMTTDDLLARFEALSAYQVLVAETRGAADYHPAYATKRAELFGPADSDDPDDAWNSLTAIDAELGVRA